MSFLLAAAVSLAVQVQEPTSPAAGPSVPPPGPAAGAGSAGAAASLPELVFADVDGDGAADALAVRAGELSLWRSVAGRGFVDVTDAFGLGDAGPVAAAAFVDFDADGRRDLFLVTAAAEGVLLRNESGAAFVDATLVSGLSAAGPILRAEWSDPNGDALPDLLVWTPDEIRVNTNLGGVFASEAIGLGAVVPSGAGPGGGWTASGSLAAGERAVLEEPDAPDAPDANGERPRTAGGGSSRVVVPGTTVTPGWTPPRAIGSAFPGNCAQLIVDAATQVCIAASSTPALGQLYPLSTELNVEAATGRVGMGTTSPGGKLHVVPGPGEAGILADGSIEVRQGASSVARLRDNSGLGGRVDVLADNGQVTMRVLGQEASGNGPQLDFYTYGGVGTATLDAEQGSEGAALHLRNAAGLTTLIHDAQTTSYGGYSQWLRADGTVTAEVRSEGSSGPAGTFHLYGAGGNQTVYADGESTGGGAGLFLSASDGDLGQIHLAEAADSLGGASHYYADGNVLTLTIEAEEVPGDGSQIQMRNYLGITTLDIDADVGNSSSDISMYNSTGLRTVQIQSEEVAGDGAQIVLRKADGTASIVLDASQGTDARITTETLQITGGADLVESFETAVACAPGSVVVVDSARPGALTLSSRAYDPRVAGVVSGAGDVRPGLHLGQDGVTAGDTPVALTGRVYVRCCDENGPVRPGDLLTSSSTPGVAMRASDPDRSFGAVLGKALGALEGGSGLVLVLVGLQ